MQSYESVVGSPTNPDDDAFRLFNPSCNELFNCVIDLIGDQPTLCQHRLLTCKVVSDMRLHCNSDYLCQRVVLAPGQCLHHISFSYVMLMSRLLSRPERASPNLHLLQVWEKSPLHCVRLSTAVHSNHACPAKNQV